MPKTNGEPGRPGIHSEGAVITGQISTQHAFCMEASRLLQQQRRLRGAPADPNQDPILRFHLRLDTPR
jgi:hypothetical protein